MNTQSNRSSWWRLRLNLGGQLLVFWFIIVLTLVLSLAGIGLWSLERELRGETRARLSSTGTLSALLLNKTPQARPTTPTTRSDVHRIWPIAPLRRLLREAHGDELLVVSKAGPRVQLGRSPLPISPGQDADLAAALRGERVPNRIRSSGGRRWLSVYRAVRLQSGARAAIRLVAEPDRIVEARLGPTRRLILLLALIDGLLAFGFGALFLHQRVLRPLRRVELASAQVAAGDVTARLPIQGSSALDPVAERFNDMLERLAAKDRRLLDQVHALQSKQKELDLSWEVLVRSAKLASVGRLTAGIAHELGNPLSSLFGYLELLDNDALDPERRADILQKIRAELRRMDTTIRALLDTARPADDHVEKVDIRQTVSRAAELAKHQKRLRDVDIHLHLEAVPPVSASTRLSQVFVNLLLNAGDAIRGSGRVDLRAEVTPTEICIRVSDTGPGIPESIRKSLFDPFVTSKAPGEGTGLGLSVSQSIVEASGGRLRLSDPQPSQGAELEIWLPRWADEDSAIDAPRDHKG